MRMPFRADQFRFYLLLASAAGRTCLAALTIGLTIWWLHSNAIANAAKDNNNLATVLAHQIDNSIQSIDLVLSEIKDKEKIRSAQATNDVDRVFRDKDTNPFLLERLSRLQQAEFIGMMDKDGSLVNSTRQWPAPKIDLSDRDYFQHFKNNNDKGVYISNSLFDRIKQRHVIVFGKRINGANGEFIGAVVKHERPGRLPQPFRPLLAGEGWGGAARVRTSNPSV